MFIFNLTDPITLILLVAATVLLIFLSKELKKPYIAAIPLAFFIVLVLLHSVQLANVVEDLNRSIILGSIAVDLIMIFVTFFGYLWVDDIACKFYKKKSIDNSLDWFWKQV